MPYLIENWSVKADPYSAPEVASAYLCGVCPERVADKSRAKVPGTSHKMITTSRIVRSEGRLVTTKSGSVYELGTVDPGYVEYLRSIGRTLDEANPVKVIDQ